MHRRKVKRRQGLDGSGPKERRCAAERWPAVTLEGSARRSAAHRRKEMLRSVPRVRLEGTWCAAERWWIGFRRVRPEGTRRIAER